MTGILLPVPFLAVYRRAVVNNKPRSRVAASAAAFACLPRQRHRRDVTRHVLLRTVLRYYSAVVAAGSRWRDAALRALPSLAMDYITILYITHVFFAAGCCRVCALPHTFVARCLPATTGSTSTTHTYTTVRIRSIFYHTRSGSPFA